MTKAQKTKALVDYLWKRTLKGMDECPGPQDKSKYDFTRSEKAHKVAEVLRGTDEFHRGQLFALANLVEVILGEPIDRDFLLKDSDDPFTEDFIKKLVPHSMFTMKVDGTRTIEMMIARGRGSYDLTTLSDKELLESWDTSDVSISDFKYATKAQITAFVKSERVFPLLCDYLPMIVED